MIPRMTTYEIIQQLGGPAQVARHLNITSPAVSQWMSKNRIPAGRVWALVVLADLVMPRRHRLTAADMRPDLFGKRK